MKLLPILAATVIAAAGFGCAMEPHHVATLSPGVRVDTTRHNIMVGESARIVAHTMDVAGGSAIKWSVSPNVGKIQMETKAGESAIFSADQPGSYVINAAVQRPDGTWVTSPDTAITVNGRVGNEK
jgi:hypothetical protein